MGRSLSPAACVFKSGAWAGLLALLAITGVSGQTGTSAATAADTASSNSVLQALDTLLNVTELSSITANLPQIGLNAPPLPSQACLSYKNDIPVVKIAGQSTFYSTIHVPNQMDVQSVSVTVTATYSRLGALLITLGAAATAGGAGRNVTLINHMGKGATAMYLTTFSDTATAQFPNSKAAQPFTGTFQVKNNNLNKLARGGSLAAAAGAGGSIGDWTLYLNDISANPDSHTGAIAAWNLTLCGLLAPAVNASEGPTSSGNGDIISTFTNLVGQLVSQEQFLQSDIATSLATSIDDYATRQETAAVIATTLVAAAVFNCTLPAFKAPVSKNMKWTGFKWRMSLGDCALDKNIIGPITCIPPKILFKPASFNLKYFTAATWLGAQCRGVKYFDGLPKTYYFLSGKTYEGWDVPVTSEYAASGAAVLPASPSPNPIVVV